ncbi:hypothetical protein MBT84_19180 [Streptomyces sp. MBT84]|nr:hypothetical protein [Streptomyces sp. MBT84]
MRFGMSMRIRSPSRTRAMVPPEAASGDAWPIDRPDVPPEKRPSVISAQAFPRPRPFRYEVGYSISCMPGPPFGPSYRMTTTSPSLICWVRIFSTASSCDSQTTAGPSKVQIDSSTPAVLTTAPSTARLPLRTARPPSLE